MSLLQRIEDHSVYELADQFGGVVGVAVGDVERASEEFAASVQYGTRCHGAPASMSC